MNLALPLLVHRFGSCYRIEILIVWCWKKSFVAYHIFIILSLGLSGKGVRRLYQIQRKRLRGISLTGFTFLALCRSSLRLCRPIIHSVPLWRKSYHWLNMYRKSLCASYVSDDIASVVLYFIIIICIITP